ncbi:hypothetical protein LINPERHAP1_LOCUS8043 [Linum perenne]
MNDLRDSMFHASSLICHEYTSQVHEMIKLRLWIIKIRIMNKNKSCMVGLTVYHVASRAPHAITLYSRINLTLGGEGSCSRYTSEGSWVLIAPIESLRTCSYR